MKIRLGPGEEEIFSSEWDLTYKLGGPVPLGIYQVWATVETDQWSISSDILDIEIKGYEQTIQLYKGWNYLSLPCYLETTDLFTVLESIWPYCISVWAYDAGSDKWLKYIVNGPVGNNLTTIEPGRGYMVNMSADAAFNIVGKPMGNSMIRLRQGWNFVGCNSTVEMPLDEALESIQYQSVYTYDSLDRKWLKNIPGVPSVDTLTCFTPGKAYWIYALGNYFWYIYPPEQQ